MTAEIRTRLGYPEELSDDEVWKDWNKRSKRVCKPCWELKYCPYGILVEQSPLFPVMRDEAIKHNEYLKRCLETGTIGEKEELTDEGRARITQLIEALEQDPTFIADIVANELRLDKLINDCLSKGIENPIAYLATGPHAPLQEYRTPFPIEKPAERWKRLEAECTQEVVAAIKDRIESFTRSLETGSVDRTRPLEEWRRRLFEKQVANFDPERYPESIPSSVSDWQCNVFGHLCPAVFACASVTETTERRRSGRYISFKTKMRVVRRDNHTCQKCGRHLLDHEVEFDHIIPLDKGGSSEEHNVRLTCFDCNRNKSNKVEI